jgi:uncharacterized membrane protein
MRYRVPVAVVALLVAGAVFGAAPALAQSDESNTSGTHMEAQLQTNGTAEWTVSVAVPVADDEEFAALREEFESGDRNLDPGVAFFRRAAEEASAATGREMTIGTPRREAELRNRTEDGEVVEQVAVLRASFAWESFARVDNGTLYVGDAFNTTDGTWLPGLREDQSLTISGPEGYGGPPTSPIGAEDGDLNWEGPETFSPGYFVIVYEPGGGPGSVGPDSDTGLTTLLLGGALLLSATALVLGLYLLYRRRDADAERPSAAETPPEPTADTDAEAGGDAAAEPADEEPDPELLSDEERVEYLLEDNGGRMKQANIVTETGWSNAKVSQLLSSMEEDDRIDKLRIGRENLISLPDETVADIEGNAEE